jgi:hypothetical protein
MSAELLNDTYLSEPLILLTNSGNGTSIRLASGATKPAPRSLSSASNHHTRRHRSTNSWDEVQLQPDGEKAVGLALSARSLEVCQTKVHGCLQQLEIVQIVVRHQYDVLSGSCCRR